jgi:hypothetical protein
MLASKLLVVLQCGGGHSFVLTGNIMDISLVLCHVWALEVHGHQTNMSLLYTHCCSILSLSLRPVIPCEQSCSCVWGSCSSLVRSFHLSHFKQRLQALLSLYYVQAQGEYIFWLHFWQSVREKVVAKGIWKTNFESFKFCSQPCVYTFVLR